jgi:hypothetical protein
VRVALALAAGLVLVALALGLTLSGSPLVLARANSTPAQGSLAETAVSGGACQGGEVLPAGTSAIRLTLESDSGPRVKLTALSGSRVLTSGVAGQGWTSGAVTVPVKPVARTTSNVRICFAMGSSKENVGFMGAPTRRAVAATGSAGETLPGRLGIEYLRPSGRSWLSIAQTIVRHMGMGRAAAGSGLALLVLVLMGALVVTASWLTLKEIR